VSELNITELVNQKVLEFGNERFLEGWNGQQERIMKLLDQKHTPTDGDTIHNESGNCVSCEVIALIKGENK